VLHWRIVLPHNALMGKKKGVAGDRHKPGRMVRIKLALARELEAYAEAKLSNLTHEVNQLVLEFLERRGLWPPQKEKNP
jgi:hypothetical protein